MEFLGSKHSDSKADSSLRPHEAFWGVGGCGVDRAGGRVCLSVHANQRLSPSLAIVQLPTWLPLWLPSQQPTNLTSGKSLRHAGWTGRTC